MMNVLIVKLIASLFVKCAIWNSCDGRSVRAYGELIR
jgi:hypothetical protein